ncbi:hypothetical protein ACR77J_07170 [Tissierella praeacuta]|uniref:hypothetical protein n=1 Tax=Tissierella praeacuta TaxID=43131 RepID=UPI003DA38BBD
MNNLHRYFNTCKKGDCINRFTNKCDSCIYTLTMKKDNYVPKSPWENQLNEIVKSEE